MLTKDNIPSKKPQAEQKHPPEYERDLNPDRLAGQNIGVHDDAGIRPASEIKELTRLLDKFTMDELRQVSVLPEGIRLEQGGTYLDLADEPRVPFTADGFMVSGPGSFVIKKADTPYWLWNRLAG